MRKLTLKLLFILPLLVTTFAPAASAHPLGGAALANQLVKVSHVGNVTHLTLPGQETNCTGLRTFWYSYTDQRRTYPEYVLQARLWVLLDYYNSYFCAEVQTEGMPRLLQNCHEFRGGTISSEEGYNTSTYDQFKCSQLLYDFFGPVDTNYNCHNGYNLGAFNTADNTYESDIQVDCTSI